MTDSDINDFGQLTESINKVHEGLQAAIQAGDLGAIQEACDKLDEVWHDSFRLYLRFSGKFP